PWHPGRNAAAICGEGMKVMGKAAAPEARYAMWGRTRPVKNLPHYAVARALHCPATKNPATA
ncbi:hypothetical protein, partial [Aminobacter sp. J44]|uniref:hypothetical protein n=1 Tax=Aminobacter sp. J44 TaxID=935262 RepID=UPI001AEE81F8